MLTVFCCVQVPMPDRTPAEAQMQGFQTPQSPQLVAPILSAKTAAVPVHIPNGYTDPHPFCSTASAPAAVGAGVNGVLQPDLAAATHMSSSKADLQATPNLHATTAGQIATTDNRKEPTSGPALGYEMQAATDSDLLNSKTGQPHLLNGALPKFKVTVPDSKHGASSAAGRPSNQASSAAVGGNSEVAASGAPLGSPKASGNLEGQPAWKSSIEVGSPTSSSRGRGRFFGRNRRGRGRSHLSRPDDQCSTGDMPPV